MDGTIIFDTGEWRTSGSSANGDGDRFAVSFTVSRQHSNLSDEQHRLSFFQLPLVSLSHALAIKPAQIVVSGDLFQANYAIFPSIGSSLQRRNHSTTRPTQPYRFACGLPTSIRHRLKKSSPSTYPTNSTIPANGTRHSLPTGKRVTSSVPPFAIR